MFKVVILCSYPSYLHRKILYCICERIKHPLWHIIPDSFEAFLVCGQQPLPCFMAKGLGCRA